MQKIRPTDSLPKISGPAYGSSEPIFYYAPLLSGTPFQLPTSSDQEHPSTTTFQALSTATMRRSTSLITTSSSLRVQGPTPSPDSSASEVGLWFKIIVLLWVITLLSISMLLFIREVWAEKEAAWLGKDDVDSQGGEHGPVQSPTTALEDDQRQVQELRKRRVRNGETVIVGHLGSESRPPDRYAEPTADVEAYIPWRFTSLDRAEVGLGIRNVGFSPPSSPSLAPEQPPAVKHVHREGGREPVGCLSRIVEMGIKTAMRKWRTEVGDDAESGLLLPVLNEERRDGDMGRRWTTAETKA